MTLAPLPRDAGVTPFPPSARWALLGSFPGLYMYSVHSVIEHIYWPSPLCYSASADMRDFANATETPKAAQRHNPFVCDVGYVHISA